jgi:ABC-2 type transport system permease protein
MRRLGALMRKEFTHMRHDPRTIMMLFMIPILLLILLGYAANTDVRNVPTVVFDQDNSQASRALLDAYRATDYLSIDYVSYSEAEVTRLIQGGQARVGIIIPPKYGSDLATGQTAQVAVLIDGSDPTVANTALSAAILIGQAHATQIQLQQLAARGAARSGALPVEIRSRVLYNPDLVSSYNMVPGVIATVLMLSTVMATSLAIVKERERGTIEQLIVTPIRSWELVIAKIVPYAIVTMLNAILILLLGTLLFGVPIRGSILLLLALSGLYTLSNLSLGLVISTFSRTQEQAQLMVMPVILVSMYLSGFLFPVAAEPPVLQAISRFLPNTYFLVIVRSIVIKGSGFDLLIPQVVALTIFALVLMGVAALRFRKTLD